MKHRHALNHLIVVCRLHLLNPHPGPNELMTFSTWAIGKSRAQIDALKEAMIFIAKARGKSCFGNDWQDALS